MFKHCLSSPTKPHRVVILGSTGFVARALARELSRAEIEWSAVGSSQIDLIDSSSVDKLSSVVRPRDALVVTSALTPEKGKDVGTFMKNIAMVEHVCASLEKKACSHVIYLSSDAVYSDKSSLVDEETALSPVGLYAVMHLAREQMLHTALAQLQVPLCIVRPCAIFGAEDTHNSYGPNRFMRSALRDGRITLFGNGEERRDHVYVEDVGRFLVECISRKSEGAVNMVSGQATSFHEVALEIAKLCPHPVQIECLPRKTPITHRHFDVGLRLRLFPEFHPVTFSDGLALSFRELVDLQVP